MKHRQFSTLLLNADLDEAEEKAQLLAEVAEPRFLDALKAAVASLNENGAKAWICTVRHKLDGQGAIVDKDGPGDFKTVGYEFAFAEESVDVARSPELEGCGASQMLALELAVQLDAETVRAFADIKIILDRLGGQALIAPYLHDERVIGFLFHYEPISRIMRGQEPDPDLTTPLPLVVTNGAGSD